MQIEAEREPWDPLVTWLWSAATVVMIAFWALAAVAIRLVAG